RRDRRAPPARRHRSHVGDDSFAEPRARGQGDAFHQAVEVVRDCGATAEGDTRSRRRLPTWAFGRDAGRNTIEQLPRVPWPSVADDEREGWRSRMDPVRTRTPRRLAE